MSTSSPAISGGEVFSGEWTATVSVEGEAFVAALMASLNAASSGSASA
jgi:hypothetical protein